MLRGRHPNVDQINERWVCQEKNCPPENFYPRIKFFSDYVENFCPTLKIFVRLARPCLTAISSAFSVHWLHVNVFPTALATACMLDS